MNTHTAQPVMASSLSNPAAVLGAGYAFLLFQDESSVQALIDACIQEDGKLYLCVSSPTIKDKPVSAPPSFASGELLIPSSGRHPSCQVYPRRTGKFSSGRLFYLPV